MPIVCAALFGAVAIAHGFFMVKLKSYRLVSRTRPRVWYQSAIDSLLTRDWTR